MIYVYPSLGGSFSMERYLNGVIRGLEENKLEYSIVKPSKNKSSFSKYISYSVLARKNKKKEGKHLIISERYSFLCRALSGAETIIVCHDMHTLHAKAKTPWIHWMFYRFLLKLMYSSSKVVCVSNYTRSELIKYIPRFKFHNDLKVVHNGIENELIKEGKQTTRNALLKSVFNKNKVLLSVGTDAWYKQNDWSIRFLEKLSNEYLLLRVGSFNYTNNELIQELGVCERIVYFNQISDLDLKYCYQNALALLFPSISEGYGWPAIEAALNDCPVISDLKGGTAEIFLDRNGIIELDSALDFLKNPEALDCKLNYLLWNDQVEKLLA